MRIVACDSAPAIENIFNLMFDEMRAFGILASFDRDSFAIDDYETYFSNHIEVWRDILYILQLSEHIKFSADIDVPYCYNVIDWPHEVGLAGFVSSNQSVKPFHIFLSYCSFWRMDLNKDSTSLYRLLKISLWNIKEQNTLYAIKFLLKLLNEGFIIDLSVIAQLIKLFIYASSTSESKDEIIHSFFSPSEAPCTIQEWISNTPSPDIIIKLIQYNNDKSNGNLQNTKVYKATIAHLLDLSLELVEEVRDSHNWDQWILGQIKIYNLVSLILDINDSFNITPPLHIRAVLSQLEEVRADVGGVVRGIGRFNPYSADFIGANAVGKSYKIIGIKDWENRVYDERLLIPSKIRELYPFKKYFHLPLEWQAVSWRIINAFKSINKIKEDFTLSRILPFKVDDLIDNKEFSDYFATIDVSDIAIQKLLIQDAYTGFSGDEYFDKVKIIEHIKYGEKYKEEDLIKIIKSASEKMCEAEAYTNLISVANSLQQENKSDFLNYLVDMSTKYPWHWWIYWEMGVIQDTFYNDGKKALELITQAIILKPQDQLLWHSLCACLHKNSSINDFQLANMIYTYFSFKKTIEEQEEKQE